MPNPKDLCTCGHFYDRHALDPDPDQATICLHQDGLIYCSCLSFKPINIHTPGYPGYVDKNPVPDHHGQLSLL